MKMILAAAFVASLLLPSNSQADPPIVVTVDRMTQATWVARISHDLEKALQFRRSSLAILQPSGAMSVYFSSGLDGRAEHVTMMGVSANRSAQRAGLRAIGKLAGLNPMPLGISPSQPIRADIVFADSDEAATQMLRRLRHDIKLRGQARSPGAPEVVVLTLSLKSTT